MPRHALGALIAALLLALAAPAAAEAVFLGAWRWTESVRGFGGFSGLEVSADGTRFAANADKGARFVEGRFRRDGEGRIIGVEAGPILRLPDTNGQPMHGLGGDAEGLAIGPDGTIYVSFEHGHRIWAYATPTAPARPLRLHIDFTRLQRNSGIEALAMGPDGALYAIPERSGALDRPYKLYRAKPGARWRTFARIPRRGAFLVVGADFGPDGRLYVLERRFGGFFGFATRVRSFAVTSGGLERERVELETEIGRHDNLEGIAVWRDGAGRIRLTMISDDNNNPLLQRTEFVEYAIEE
jgi:hypothetical protein